MRSTARSYSLLFLLLTAVSAWTEAQMPKATQRTTALVGGQIITVTSDTIRRGSLLIRNGIIEAIGDSINVPVDAEVIDCAGLSVFPGLIDGGTRLGLVEVESDPRTQDFNEIGDVVPQMKALTAVNPNSALIPVTRVSGVTSALVVPSGKLFSGTAALIDLHGYTPDYMFAGFEGVVLFFPESGRRNAYDKRSDDEIKKTTEKEMKKLNEAWDKAVQYHRIDSALTGQPQSYYPELEALLPVVSGKMKLLIEVNREGDIVNALEWIRERKLENVVLTGVAEGARVADKIADAKIPVITGPVLALPRRAYDRYDAAYSNAGVMDKAGVTVALRTNGAENVRNLAFHAGFAAAYGLGKQKALRAVTIVPAEIFGVSENVGSLQRGKQATLFVCNGDPFEPATEVLHVFIKGWRIPMISRQTELYEEFLNREPGLIQK